MSTVTVEQALQIAIRHYQAGQTSSAEEICREILAREPAHADTLAVLGVIAGETGRYDEAIEILSKAIAQAPEEATGHCDLGVTYRRAGQLEEAAACFRRALALQPNLPDTHSNLGETLFELGQFEEAIACCRRALALKPDLAGGHWNLALTLLLLGHYEEGWREYEWRLAHSRSRRTFSAPRWDGTPAPGRTILLHAEQGLGDVIQFMRYVPLVRERADAARVIVESPPALVRLLAQSGGRDADIVVTGSAGDPPFDLQLPLLSLPLTLGCREPLPSDAPYLHADPALRAAWRERLDRTSKLRVGVAWAGRPQHSRDRVRSIAFEKLGPILRVPDVSFYSLQFEPGGAPPPRLASVIDLTAHITDFADTAALVAELDLIISVDTSTAHLAGALGRPVWTLLAFVPDWRWRLDREDTPWYPTMRLFRQPTAGDWESVVRRVADELRQQVES